MSRTLSIAIALTFAASSPEVASAQNQWKPSVLRVHSPDPDDLARVNDDGTLKKTDEEFTNEQAVVKMFGDGIHGIYVEMRTGALESGETPVHRMQGACTPIQLAQAADGTVRFVKLPGERFISDNDGNEYRNFNKPELMPVNGGRNMLVMFNYQPEGTNDTRRYAKVIDQGCNEIPVLNAGGEQKKQVLIMAKNNDDCDMHQTGEGPCDIATDAGGVTHLSCWAGCNGNGEDDGWLNDITVDCDVDGQGAATACTIKKNFDISLCQREERSRGRCSISDEDVNTAICTWTEGNNQPQRDGTWIAAVDIGPGGELGEDAQSRLLWKEQIDGRKETADYETYSVRAKHTRLLVPAADGTLARSNMIVFHSGDLEGKNRDDKKGGTYRAMQVVVMKATAGGLEYLTPKIDATDMLLGIDGTHLTMCGAVFGEDAQLMPGFTLLQGSHNGGGVTEPVAKAIGIDTANMSLVDLGTHRVGGSYDRHLYSNYLGNNPGNQGRNFAGCTLLKNPFAGMNGNLTQYFLAHALTGKDPSEVGNAALKPSSYVTLLPVATVSEPAPPPEAEQIPPPAEEAPPPTDPPAADPVDEPANEPGKAPQVMACAAAGAGGRDAGLEGGLVVLGALGFGIVVGARRRVALLALLLAACEGGLYTGPGSMGPPAADPGADAAPIDPGADPRVAFETTVAPVLQAKCSAAGCHGGAGTTPLKFLPGEMSGYYDVVVSYDDRVVGYFDETSAPLLKKIIPGPHYAVTYTAGEVAAIEAWFAAELAANNGGEPPPPSPVTPGELSKQLIAEWSGCMDVTAWNDENVAEEWATLGSSEGPCIRCHVNGQASFIATDESVRMFEILTTNKYYLLSYFAPNVTDLATAKMEINYGTFERVANGEYPHIEHPGFDTDNDAILALEQFYTRTMDRKAAGLCDPPRIEEP